MLRVVEAKLYPTAEQAETLSGWLRVCCWIYNRALEHRIKAYKRRKESVGFYTQGVLLTHWRQRMAALKGVPVGFARGALLRVDRGMQAFFRRVKAGERPGFPRFRPHRRYTSLESLKAGQYIKGRAVRIPNVGPVRARVGKQITTGIQRLLRVIRRASGWYAQVLLDDGKAPPEKVSVRSAVGVDVGLESFATLSTGEKIDNPRWGHRAERELRTAHRNVGRKRKGSRNRRKAVNRLGRAYEKVSARRRDFAHQLARSLVNRFDLIAFEKLNIRGLARARLRKSVLDAAWGLFLGLLASKAECAGRHAVPVNPRGTSMTCPGCGRVEKKELRERVHACVCGCVLDRDVAAARVILSRAPGVAGAMPAEGSASVGEAIPR